MGTGLGMGKKIINHLQTNIVGPLYLVVPPFGPELKFEPELLRTGLRSCLKFEGQVEPNLLFGPWFG
jgi:hypothetical protein